MECVRTRRKALIRLLEMLRTHPPFEKLTFLHSAERDEAQALRDEVREHPPGRETWLEMINPVPSTHLGPGVVGFACVTKK